MAWAWGTHLWGLAEIDLQVPDIFPGWEEGGKAAAKVATQWGVGVGGEGGSAE